MTEETIYPCKEGPDFPVVDILTGRGFITGKSGSGKSNTAGKILEELLENNFPFLIVDTEGEYYGLKEKFEILHVGADENCDVRIGPEHASKIADLSLDKNVPIVLDVSGFIEEEDAKKLVKEVLRLLFNKEKKKKKPFLVVIEECHEYIPEQVQLDDCGQVIIKIAKRGRKRGLGILGISQRPANVKKDFITQANYKIWHHLDWDTDLDVVRRVIGKDSVETVKNLETGEALIDADFIEGIQKAAFKERETFHAGQTPTLSSFETPDLKEVSESLVEELEEISEEEKARQDRVKALKDQVEKKNEQIENLETRIDDLRDHSKFAERFVQAIEDKISGGSEQELEVELEEIEGLRFRDDEIISKLDQILTKLDSTEEIASPKETEQSQGEKEDKDIEEPVSDEDILDNEEFVEEIKRLADSSSASKKALVSTVSYLNDNQGTLTQISNFAGYKNVSSISRAVSALRDADIVEETDKKDGKSVFNLSENGIQEIISRRKSRERMTEISEKL